MAAYFLGADNGCTVAKAALFTADGRELAVASRKVAALAGPAGWSEVDMTASWRATAESIRQVLAAARVNPAEIACVACTGHGNGLYLVGPQGEPVRNAILSMDNRARAYVERWRAAGVDRAVRPKTMQSLWAAQPNALLAWLADHEPQTLARAGWALMCKDYIRFRLTGQIAAELTDMSGTSLLNVGKADYDADVLAAFGIEQLRRLLPPLVRSAEVCGKVSAAATAETGLAEGTPVAGGLFDVDACGLSSGLTDEAPLSIVAGTWGCNQYVSRTPVADDGVFMTSCYAMPGWYLMLEGSPTSASNLEWFVTEFFAAEREAAERDGGSVFDLCNRLVAETTPEETDLVFLPFLYGTHAHADAKASFVGLGGWHRRGHVLRAIYEGVAMAHRWHVERLLRHRPRPQCLRLTGGAARSPQWLQVFADCFQLPVEVPAGTELGALGAAMCAAVAAGCYADFPAAVAAMVRFDRRQQPDAARGPVYDAKYARYQKLIAALDGLWPL